MSEPVVVVQNVTKIYEGPVPVYALRDVSLTFTKGAFAALSGPSGSGKTTLLNLIGGLDKPTSGDVVVGGQSLVPLSRSALAELRLREIGFIFQSYNLVPVLSAVENVEFVMELQGVPRAERREKARQVLAAVGLSGMEHRRPGELSGGQQQRVAVARAIASHPKLILADEPTANLDSQTAEKLLELMRQLNEEQGLTFLFSTHDRLVMNFARRLIRLQDGEVVGDEVVA